ncbi:MAG TPA: hemolysin family protein [archaeon]|nr:hemolysin family protein [archaeon]
MFFTALQIDFLILIGLVALSAFFSSAETAFISMNRIKVKRLIDMNVTGARLLQELKSRPQKTLISILIANNLLNFSAASLAAAIALEIFPEGYGIAISTGLITFIILIFSEITPKSFALKHAPFIALRSAPVLLFLSWALSPLIILLEKISGFFIRLTGSSLDEQKLTEEEVKAAVTMSAEEGSILAEEKEMIHRIFLLNDITVKQVMAPRESLNAISSGTLVKDIDPKFLKAHPRFPVYRSNLDDIIGVFYVRDYLGKGMGSQGNIAVDQIMRRPLFVHESKKLDRLLADFRRKKTQLAIVVDSKGDTVGLVTIEDVMEEIVGEIKEN